MRTAPAVTVCIPTRNRRTLLAASLQSVLRQSLRDVEIIVSDNGSTDGTGEYVRSLDDERVRYEPLHADIGLFGNLSRCLHLGQGRYRVVLPDDDLMLPGNLERKVRFLDENPTATMVHSAFRYLGRDGAPFGGTENWSRLSGDSLDPGAQFIRRSLKVGGIVCVSSVMLRSDRLTGERFDAADGPYADLALWLRMAARGDAGFLADPLSGYRVHDSSASSGFKLVESAGGRHRMTSQHADAVLQAHGRFVQRARLEPALREELCALVAECDRRMRWSIRANRAFPPAVLAALKTATGWRSGGRLHRRFALDAEPAAARRAARGTPARQPAGNPR